MLGILLMVFAFVMLYRLEPLAQYIAPAPTEPQPNADDAGTRPDSMLAGVIKEWQSRRTELGEGAKAGIASYAYNRFVSLGESAGEQTTVVCVGAGWFDVHPRFLKAGCLFSAADHANAAHKAVLDEELAFKLFPTTDACGRRVQLDGVWYDVVGVVRRADSPGDADDYRMYVPVTTAAALHMQTDYLQLEAAADSSGIKRALETIGGEILGNGSFYDTGKEVMRATMMARLLFVLFGMYYLFHLLNVWNRRTVQLIKDWFEEVKRRYFKSMLPGVIGLSLLQLSGYCIIAAAAWGLLSLVLEPMYVFTEWIPEVIVEWSKIAGRAEELLRANAQVVRCQTREYAAIRLYGALVRWGVVCLLSGAVLYKVWPEKKIR